MLHSGQRKQSYTNAYYGRDQIASVLKQCDIKIVSEIETHFLLLCPFHYNTNTPACEIDKKSGVYLCFACGENGTFIDMVMKSTGRNYFESMRVINTHKDSSDIFTEVEDLIEESSELPEFDMDVIKSLHSNLMSDNRAQEYFSYRKITKESQEELLLGFSVKQDMVTVPVFDAENKCLGFVGRSLEGKRFKNSTGLPKSKVLYNLNRCKYDRMSVVESSFDAIRLWQIGIPAVATLGATVSKIQISLLNKYASSIIVCPDNDAAGAKMESRIVDSLPKKSIECVRLPHGKDVGDHDDKELHKLFRFSGKKLILSV